MNTYGSRLLKALTETGKQRQELAEAIGVTVQAIGQVIKGDTKALSAENSAKAARFLGVDDLWLAAGKGKMRAAGAVSVESTDIAIPEYDVAGAMGNGGLILEEQPPGIITGWRVDHEWLRLNVPSHTGIKNLCIVTGFGASMQPKYNPGDPLLMDSGIKEVKTDGIYFFRIGEHGFIKQLQRIPKGSEIIIRAKSLNPDYDPFEITSDMDFHVLGKILTVWRSEQV